MRKTVFHKIAIVAILITSLLFSSYTMDDNNENNVNRTITIAGIEMVKIDIYGDEDDFYISKYEVTRKQYYEVLDNTYYLGGKGYSSIQIFFNSHPQNGNSYNTYYGSSEVDNNIPVVGMDLNQIDHFLKCLREQTGKRFRLPTELEWRFANSCNGIYDCLSQAWFANNSGGCLHPVGQKEPNSNGVYDMYGNAAELCMEDKKSRGCIAMDFCWLNEEKEMEKFLRRPKYEHCMYPKPLYTGFRLVLDVEEVE